MALDETWLATDLPVLEAVITLLDDGTRTVEPRDVARATALDAMTVDRAMNRLDGEYLVLSRERIQGSSGILGATAATAAARRAVGQWPSGDSLADRVLAELEERLDATTNEDERTRLVKARDALVGMGRDLLVDVTAAAITRQMGTM